MIGVDTNVLLRFIEPEDDPVQTAAVRTLVETEETVFLNPIVLVEFVWVLKTSFGLDRTAIHKRLERLVSAPQFTFAFPAATERAVGHYGRGPADFADCLIGELNLEFECEATLTFDKRASKTNAFRSLTS